MYLSKSLIFVPPPRASADGAAPLVVNGFLETQQISMVSTSALISSKSRIEFPCNLKLGVLRGSGSLNAQLRAIFCAK